MIKRATKRRSDAATKGLAGLAALTLSYVLAGDALAQGGRPATAVNVARVENTQLEERRRVTGSLRAIARSRVATLESGRVTTLPIVEGQLVKEGDVLAVLDDRRLQIEHRRLEAQTLVRTAMVDVREAERDLTRSDLETVQSLAANDAANPKQLADAESELRIAQARVDEAKRDLDVTAALTDLIQIRIDDKTIVAPFDGVVIQKHTERGEWVGEGDAIAEMVSVGAYHAWLDVPQRFADSLTNPDTKVQIEIDATARLLDPAVPTLIRLVNPTARTFSLYIEVDDPKLRLAPGMSITGWVPSGNSGKFITVPRDALLRNEAGFYVYVARGEAPAPVVATPAAVTILFHVDDRVAVRSNEIRGGDMVVVEGNERLFPMMPITFEPPQMETARR